MLAPQAAPKLRHGTLNISSGNSASQPHSPQLLSSPGEGLPATAGQQQPSAAELHAALQLPRPHADDTPVTRSSSSADSGPHGATEILVSQGSKEVNSCVSTGGRRASAGPADAAGAYRQRGAGVPRHHGMRAARPGALRHRRLPRRAHADGAGLAHKPGRWVASSAVRSAAHLEG